ncbi:hypothetical protein EKO04_010154 [Ascochyta lentis]|uniref:Cupin type-2 domain-containing protein n=1 Tax=Ascochyta lentis TaxID=205686 RepID=A0A8H7IYW3_9PLEO|nr:hypothetical protein EKO04_010154 [Ascochyta lentis]
MSAQKPITHFGLRDITRYTTTVDSNGNGVFSRADQGDFEATMGDRRVARFDLFQAGQVPLNINDGADIKWSGENQPGLHVPNGVAFRMMDFAPEGGSDWHRAALFAFVIIVEGELELSLDGGETKVLLPGDTTLVRGPSHKVRNPSTAKPCRTLWVLLDITPTHINGKLLKHEMGHHTGEYQEGSK